MTREDGHPPGPLSTKPESLSAQPLDEEALHDAKTLELARALVDRATLLARKEVELAQAEAREGIRHGVMAGSMAGTAGLCLGAALVCGLVAAISAIGAHVLSVVSVSLIGLALFVLLAAGFALVTVAEGRAMKPARSVRQARLTADLLRTPRLHAPT